MNDRPALSFALALVATLIQWGLLFIAGCVPLPEKKVIGPDIASYTRTEHVVSCWDMTFQYCMTDVPVPFKPLVITPMGCAVVDFRRETCDIYTCWYSPPAVLAHERRHCQGWDHLGTLQRAYDDYIDGRIGRPSYRDR